MRKIILFSVIQQFFYHISKVESLIGDNFTRVQGGEFPFIAFLQYFPEEDNFCMGALISNKHVLTAAHCLEDETPGSLRIVFEGVRVQQEFVLTHTVASWTTYFDWATIKGIPYDPNSIHNIAVVELKDRVYNVNPVRLNKLTKRQLDGKAAILTGWKDHALSKATVNLLNDEDCERSIHVLNDEPAVDNRTLCSTANPFALLGNGDGGSPLLYSRDNSLLGIAHGWTPDDNYVNGNFTIEFIRQHQVNVHFSIQYYRTFIFSVVPAAPGA